MLRTLTRTYVLLMAWRRAEHGQRATIQGVLHAARRQCRQPVVSRPLSLAPACGLYGRSHAFARARARSLSPLPLPTSSNAALGALPLSSTASLFRSPAHVCAFLACACPCTRAFPSWARARFHCVPARCSQDILCARVYSHIAYAHTRAHSFSFARSLVRSPALTPYLLANARAPFLFHTGSCIVAAVRCHASLQVKAA